MYFNWYQLSNTYFEAMFANEVDSIMMKGLPFGDSYDFWLMYCGR
jgi:hypothetical protein